MPSVGVGWVVLQASDVRKAAPGDTGKSSLAVSPSRTAYVPESQHTSCPALSKEDLFALGPERGSRADDNAVGGSVLMASGGQGAEVVEVAGSLPPHRPGAHGTGVRPGEVRASDELMATVEQSRRTGGTGVVADMTPPWAPSCHGSVTGSPRCSRARATGSTRWWRSSGTG